jgi:hypothetical protein
MAPRRVHWYVVGSGGLHGKTLCGLSAKHRASTWVNPGEVTCPDCLKLPMVFERPAHLRGQS